MLRTQITHNDLDGYGASTVVSAYAAVARVIHIARYRDLPAVAMAEKNRLEETDVPEMLILTDLGLEKATVRFIRAFAEMNAERPGREHRLVIIDHHASSIDQLTAGGLHALPGRAENPTCEYFAMPEQTLADYDAPWDAPIVVLVDPSASATKLAYVHASLYADTAAAADAVASDVFAQRPQSGPTLEALVEAVDAVDLWKRERPTFDTGESLNEIFWESVGTFIPEGHELHDAFVSSILIGSAGGIVNGMTAERIEIFSTTLRNRVVTTLIKASGLVENEREAAMTTRMRVSRLLARSQALFVDAIPGINARLCYAMDPGIFQRVSDEMLIDDPEVLAINIMRGGAMSFRSTNGSAMTYARKLGGGGHTNASGARLNCDGVFSLMEAKRLLNDSLDQVERRKGGDRRAADES